MGLDSSKVVNPEGDDEKALAAAMRGCMDGNASILHARSVANVMENFNSLWKETRKEFKAFVLQVVLPDLENASFDSADTAFSVTTWNDKGDSPQKADEVVDVMANAAGHRAKELAAAIKAAAGLSDSM